MSKKVRILYAAGCGDVIDTYKHWVEGQDDPSQLSITYSGQFYEVCRDLDAQAYVISSCEERKFLHDGRFLIEHRPMPLRSSSGLLYHLGLLWYGLRLIASAIRFRADVAVVSNGTTHWFILSLLPLFGVAVIPSLHCTLWRKYIPQRKAEKLILRLSHYFFASSCAAMLAISDEISEQIAQLTANQHRQILKFFPTYRRKQFAEIDAPDKKRKPFRVLFASRIEQDKGVFDLLEIAKRLAALGRQDITFELCGGGSVLESVSLAAKAAGIDSHFVCHGHCNKQKMRQILNQTHVVIVPTKSDFLEGFNKVVAEGILSGRPVVTSAVCPAISSMQDAFVEVPPDDINSYTEALLKLCNDREFYEQKRQSCLGVQEQFYDTQKSWGKVLKSVLLQFVPVLSCGLNDNLQADVE
jgi:glycosyltransferase involved in cell wall biosynthesis